MEKLNLLLVFLACLIVTHSVDWVPYAVVSSTQAVNTFSFDLNAGDNIQFAVSSQSSYYGYHHEVDGLLMLNGNILQTSTFETPGSVTSNIYSVSVGQEGSY